MIGLRHYHLLLVELKSDLHSRLCYDPILKAMLTNQRMGSRREKDENASTFENSPGATGPLAIEMETRRRLEMLLLLCFVCSSVLLLLFLAAILGTWDHHDAAGGGGWLLR